MSDAAKIAVKRHPTMRQAKEELGELIGRNSKLLGPHPRRKPLPVARPSVDPKGALPKVLHDVNNTLGALRLRIGVLARDPSCQWAHQENLDAIVELVKATALLV